MLLSPNRSLKDAPNRVLGSDDGFCLRDTEPDWSLTPDGTPDSKAWLHRPLPMWRLRRPSKAKGPDCPGPFCFLFV